MHNPFFADLEEKPRGTKLNLQAVMAQLRFNEQGLIPVIAQQHDSGEVLMMAWMNRDALAETLSSGQVCYWSRSRSALWRKGESSGHVQRLVELRIDCDGDAILCRVEQTGPACHTDRQSCFYFRVDGDEVEVTSDRG